MAITGYRKDNMIIASGVIDGGGDERRQSNGYSDYAHVMRDSK